MKGKTMTFEESMQQLSAILANLESGELTLEESIEAYEKAVKTISVCRSELEKSRRKIEMLKQGSTTEIVELEDEFADKD